jgi:hypothetical protein
MSTMKHIYIAGPYRGEDSWQVEQNIRVAEGLGFLVAEEGAVPVIPHTMYRHFNGTLGDDFWLRATLSLLKRCDAMLLCPGWRNSEGSIAEHENFDGPQFESLVDLKEWLRSNS